jgi:hypothetical protein
MLEQAVLQAEEQAKALEERMHEEIKRQVQIAISAQRQTSDPRMNVDISPLISSKATALPLSYQFKKIQRCAYRG